MLYVKIVNGQEKFSNCRTILMPSGVWVSNPSPEQIEEAGWTEYVPPAVEIEPEIEPEATLVLDAIKKMLSTEINSLSDEEALSVAALYPTWFSKIGETIGVGERVWYDNNLYKVIQQHTVQESWNPVDASSLFVLVSIEEWPELVVPISSANPYMIGDKVTYNNNHYICKLDNCVWTPNEYPAAWELVQ